MEKNNEKKLDVKKKKKKKNLASTTTFEAFIADYFSARALSGVLQ